jgi:hypothetical protein
MRKTPTPFMPRKFQTYETTATTETPRMMRTTPTPFMPRMAQTEVATMMRMMRTGEMTKLHLMLTTASFMPTMARTHVTTATTPRMMRTETAATASMMPQIKPMPTTTTAILRHEFSTSRG